LAPREVARQAPKPASESSGNRFGVLLVAAVVLLATGAWFLTAGSFRRATLTEVPNRQGTETAAASQPMNNMAAAKTSVTEPPNEQVPSGADSNANAANANAAAPAPVANASNVQNGANESAAPGPALKNKPSLTATVRGERTRGSKRAGNGKAAPAATGEVAQGPTRGEVITRLESVRPAVHACAAGRSGVADLDITIAHTGTVMHVLVGGDFAGTTEGTCIARAVRQAHFPAFKQERFRLLYPYAI
jgi:cytoskeletal protein RodZ